MLGDDPLEPGSVTPDQLSDTARQVRKALYWDKKDLASYVVVARHLLNTALSRSRRADESAKAFGERALGLSYDIASFTWRGWDEPDISVTPALEAVGLAAARLNAELASEDGRSDDVKRRSLWMLGAQLLAAGDAEGAKSAWSDARALAPPDDQTLAAWILLADVAKGGDPAALESCLLRLEAQAGELADVAKQISTARRTLATQP
jgi:hypothetical protein